MVVRIRLARFGRRGAPFYRVVVADARAPRDGKFIEKVGTYQPKASRLGDKEMFLDVERVKYWISVGAQPSDRVAKLLGYAGVLPPPPFRGSVPASSSSSTSTSSSESS